MLFKNTFQVQITGSTHTSINSLITYILYILTQNKILDLKISKGHFPKKIKKFTVLKSPHVFKTARTQLEMRAAKITLIITNFSTATQVQSLKYIFQNLIKNVPISTRVNIKYFKVMFI
jgi:ribosomal protein S10